MGQMNSSGIDTNESVTPRAWVLPVNYLQRFGLAVVSIGVALGASLLLQHFGFRVPSALLLLFAVAISSWYGGPGPAVLAIVLSITSFYWFFVEPVRTIYIYRSEIPLFIIFIAFAALLSWFGRIRRRVEANLRQLNRKLRAISNCNELLLRATDEQSLIDQICRIVCEEAGFRMAWVGYAQDDDVKSVCPVAWFGVEDGYLAAAEISSSEETVRGRGPGGMAIRTGRTSCSQDFATDANFAWRKAAVERGYRSAISIPLKDDNAKTFGILTIYSTEPNAFTSEEVLLLEELAADLAFGIVTLRSRTARKQAEQALRQSEAYLAEAQRLSHTGSWGWNAATGEYDYWSEETLRIYGFDPRERLATGEELFQRIHPDDRDRWRKNFEKSLREKLDTSEEYRIVLPDGTVKHIHAIRHPVLNEAGDLVRFVGSSVDITERYRAEEALRRSEAYLAEGQRLSHTGSWAWSPATGETLYWSGEMFRIFGLNPEEGVPNGERFWQRIHPEDLERMHQLAKKAALVPMEYEHEHRIVLPDGTVKHIHWFGHPVLNQNGQVAEYVGTTIDVTERKRAEEALRQSEAYLAEAQRLSHSGSFAFDVASNKYVYISEECLRIFELDAQQSLQPREAVSRFIQPEDWDRVQRDFEKLLREKVDTPSEFRIVPPSGAAKHIQVIRHPVLNGAGEVVTIVGTAIDITERKRAEEALRLANAYNRGLIEASLDPLVTIGPDGRITDVNAATEAATGRSRGELIGSDFCDYFTEPAKARAGYKQVFREGWVRDYPLELRHRDGNVISVSYNAAVYRDESGEVVGVFAVARDVTERKRAEEALRESEMRFRTFVDHAADALFVQDEERHKVLDVNRQACESLGYTREELIGMVPHDFYPDANGAPLQWIQERLEAGGASTFETRHRRKDGTVFPVEVRVRPFQHGGRQLHLALARDISERKRAEEALRESETRFRTFVDHAADAFLMLDFDQGTIVDVNRQACDSLGYTRQELIGNTPHIFHLDSDRAGMESTAERAAAGETAFDRHWHRRKDGSLFPVEVSTSVFLHRGRRFLLRVARDITDRLRAEEQREKLRQLEAELAHLDRLTMLGELTASIAHEVNQPLAGVVSNGSACLRWLAGETPNIEEAREAARRIVRDGKRAAEVVARVRAMTKRTEASSEKLDVNETIRDVLALVGDEAKKNRVLIRTEFADNVFPVLGDRVQLQQVLLNLVMNGMEAMSNVGENARELAITTRNVDPNQVQVTVQDSGIGVDPDTMPKIFEPFYTTKPSGMGMGLSICRSILQAHGGQLWAAANEGPGTSFHFTLPRHEAESNAAA